MRSIIWVVLLIFVPSAHSAETFEIMLWSPDDVDLTPLEPFGMEYVDRLGNRHWDHPCGTVMKAEVDRMPPPGQEDFNPLSEKVFELNERMEQVHAWSMPVDSWVMGVKGSALIVSYRAKRVDKAGGKEFYENRALAIDTHGDMMLLEKLEPQKERIFECEAATKKLFGETAYAACHVFEDMDTGRERIILYQSPCT